MKNLEKSGNINDSKMQTFDTADSDAYKVRRGKISGYKDYLSQDDLEYIDSSMSRPNCAFGYKI